MTVIWSKEVFAKNLRMYLERSGKTQKELAEIVGVSAPTMNDWIKGKKYPRIDKIEILADYFGILKSDLIEEKTEEHLKMKKKNNVLSDIVLKMNEDEELLSMVETLSKLDFEKREAVRTVINAFSTTEK